MQTEMLYIEVPRQVAERLRERIRAGEFPDESSAIEVSLAASESVEVSEHLPELLRPLDMGKPAISATPEEWEEHILPSRLAYWEASGRRTLSMDEVAARLLLLKQQDKSDIAR